MLKVDYWPITRDTFAFLIALLALVVTLADKKIQWYEAAILITIYLLYLIGMCGFIYQFFFSFFLHKVLFYLVKPRFRVDYLLVFDWLISKRRDGEGLCEVDGKNNGYF